VTAVRETSGQAGTLEKLQRYLEAQELLYLEARLLDEGRLDEWLDLFTDDALYSLPIVVDGGPREPSLIKDSKTGMEERVFRLTKTLAHAQNPPSRTQHDVTNIEVQETADGVLEVFCNQTVHELRTGDVFHIGLATPRTFAARCRYLLVPGKPWRIREKTCTLLDREYPQYNLTFVF
jgi:3-phenylpropionate/cinnamic acid dioxygenase small subunit